MKQKRYTLLILLAVLLVVGGGAYFVTTLNNDTQTEAQEISAYSFDEKIKQISYKPQNSEAISFVNENDLWLYENEKSFPVNQTYPSAMLNYTSNVTATRYVGESSDLKEYGLDNPILSIDITTETDKVKTLLIGSKNTHTNDYYFMVDGENSVYTVGATFPDAFKYTLYEMAQITQPTTLVPKDIISVNLTQNGETITLVGEDNLSQASDTSSQSSSDSDASTLQNERSYFIKSNDLVRDASSSDAESWLYTALNLLFNTCVEYKPQSLDSYGLSKPGAVLKVTYQKQADTDDSAPTIGDYTILIGNGAADGSRYVMLEGDPMVYTADASVISEILALNANSFKVEQ